jgi:hypothetical protein
VPLKFWDEAFITVAYLINRLPTRVIDNLSPLERLFKIPPNYSMLKIFGCACWSHLRPYNKHKLSFRSKPCVFIGYSSLHKGYKCLDIDIGRVYISRDVIFDEAIFPFSTPSSTIADQSQGDNSFNCSTNLLHDLSPVNSVATGHPGTEHHTSTRQISSLESEPILQSLANNPAPAVSSVQADSVPRNLESSSGPQTLPEHDSAPGFSPVEGASDLVHGGPHSAVHNNDATMHADMLPSPASAATNGPTMLAPSLIIPPDAPAAGSGAATSQQNTQAPAHPYGTRLKHHIHQPKVRTDGTVTYSAARTSSVVPSSHSTALEHPL